MSRTMEIPTEIMKQMATIKLSPTQYRLLFVVWTYTFGFKRDEHELSLGFFATATGCDRRQIQRELKGLEDKRIIYQKIDGQKRVVGFNQNTSEWSVTIGETTNGETDGVGETTNSAIGEIDNSLDSTIGETTNTTIGETTNQEKDLKDLKIYQEEEEMTVMSAYKFSFNKFHMTGHIQDYIGKLLKRGFDEKFLVEILLEMGERGVGPDVRYMTKLAEDWIEKKCYSREEARRRREQSKVRNIDSRRNGNVSNDPPAYFQIDENDPITQHMRKVNAMHATTP